ncbi:putative membrane protein [Wickerhamomyces ciferrii]|uniref:Membrane protein n=1 Tax=Wickerhamomyces ciferrii (strain ATCC 14091 / BCRC 22168 / CBS 111 / JCM 3599 / NBRC 0793 / NRRL Y-1031 F-60-10) TaxID=1206466 RepID=K0KNH3_WICCF|nr:uncharacterized protein BN7_4112 [Wickerhamomyces ciferrii]CCH44546.1 putative membrane protein [Wickerhamomyces ciferrii]
MSHTSKLHQLLIPITLLICMVNAEMEMDDTEEFTRPNITNAGSKTFHWLMTLLLLLIVPSLATVLTFAEKLHTSVFLQLVSLGYAALEALFLRFPDGDGVENRTSRGTAWFLLFLNGATVFVGSLNSGTNWFLKNKNGGEVHWIANLGERSIRIIHRTLSVLLTLTGWIKTCLAPVAMFGFCREIHTGQCIAHGIMGTAFIGYGLFYALILVLPYFRETRHKNSQDFYDSLVMTVWGIVNTFTEHRWGREGWGHGDYQHTAMGIIWWSGGLLGLYLGRGGRRTWIPSLLLIYTGWAMSEHNQHLAISTKVHYMFGLSLMLGGFIRILEITFLLNDERSIPGKIMSFQYLPSFCLIESGVMFMAANEEQLRLVLRLEADHSSYIMVVTSAAFLIYLWFLLLLELYQTLTASYKIDLTRYASVSGTDREQQQNDDLASFELDDLEEDRR